MKQTVFRKVMVKDRLPEYNTYVGIVDTLGSIGNAFHTSKGVFKSSHIPKSIDVTFAVEFWLEEIELPAEKDIYTLSSRCATNERMNGFEEGANYILNKLK